MPIQKGSAERNPNFPKKSPAATEKANNEHSTICTFGEAFPGGPVIELIQEAPKKPLSLFLSDGDTRKIAPQVDFRGHVYRVADINHSILLATRFPTKCDRFGSTAKLFAEVRNAFMSYGFPEDVASPTTYFNFAAWFPDCLPAAPCLLLTGPPAEARLLLELLGCMVRHPLPLGQIPGSDLCSLPMYLQPTLLINKVQNRGSAWELLNISNHHCAYIPRKEGLVNVYCAKAVYLGENREWGNYGDSMLRINLPSLRGRFPILDARDQQEISERFQPKFLDYRCRNVMKVRESRCDFPELDSSIRILGRILGAPIADAPELQADLAPLLREYQKGIRASKWLDLRCVTLEAILDHCHKEPGKRVHVGTLTDTINRILKGQGERTKFEPEVIGGILRGQLGFSPERDSEGYYILLDNRVCRYAHQLAYRYDVAAVQEGIAQCSDCSAILATEGKNPKRIDLR